MTTSLQFIAGIVTPHFTDATSAAPTLDTRVDEVLFDHLVVVEMRDFVFKSFGVTVSLEQVGVLLASPGG
jgi:hypothetical protein